MAIKYLNIGRNTLTKHGRQVAARLNSKANTPPPASMQTVKKNQMKEFSFTRLGKNILAIRTRLKLTQLDFAALFDHVPGSGDTRRSNVSLYEAGKSRPPMEFVFEIAAKTGFTLDELFGEVLDQRILGRSLAEPGDSYIIGVSDPEPALPQRARGSWVRYETLQRLFLEAFRRGGLREGGYFDQGTATTAAAPFVGSGGRIFAATGLDRLDGSENQFSQNREPIAL